MSKYSKESLNTYCQENNIQLIKDYSNEKIWSQITLEGKCIRNGCINYFKKMFKNLLKNNGYCNQCMKGNNKNHIVIYNYTLLNFYCNEKHIILNKDYSTENLCVLSSINGICEIENCKNTFECKFKTLIKSGALCKECFYKKRTEITKKTNIKKYGVEFISQVPEIRKRAEQTMLDKYGVKHTSQSKELFNKMKKTNIEKYGCEYYLK